MSDVFLSYASADRSRVKPLADALRQRGWSVWWDRTVLPGETWDQVIEKALAEARCVIVLWSRDSIKSDWVRAEADEGKRRGILVPAVLDNVRIPLPYSRIQAANLVEWTGLLPNTGLDELAQAVSEVLSRSAPPLLETAPRAGNASSPMAAAAMAGEDQLAKEIGESANKKGVGPQTGAQGLQVGQSEAKREPLPVGVDQFDRRSLWFDVRVPGGSFNTSGGRASARAKVDPKLLRYRDIGFRCVAEYHY